MEFWGVEVKAGESVKVFDEKFSVIHISQAALGGDLNGEDKGLLIPLRVKIEGNTFIMGSLSVENFPQVFFDLVFDKEFELSHDSKHASVHFIGYKAMVDDDDFSSSDDSDQDDLIAAKTTTKDDGT
ncbi:histone deacetylase HDT1-like [Impatiens glandulifera]|uniref:histone deacetylase HDT1-like n=1 Tax=Impatiens glandulifera TaxID=253017 RepID=UPI001FB140FD|nr:histone deacetylase HDT1-like [Impatiens glandulifera]